MLGMSEQPQLTQNSATTTGAASKPGPTAWPCLHTHAPCSCSHDGDAMSRLPKGLTFISQISQSIALHLFIPRGHTWGVSRPDEHLSHQHLSAGLVMSTSAPCVALLRLTHVDIDTDIDTLTTTPVHQCEHQCWCVLVCSSHCSVVCSHCSHTNTVHRHCLQLPTPRNRPLAGARLQLACDNRHAGLLLLLLKGLDDFPPTGMA